MVGLEQNSCLFDYWEMGRWDLITESRIKRNLFGIDLVMIANQNDDSGLIVTVENTLDF